MSTHRHYKISHTNVLVAALYMMPLAVSGCAHKMPAEDPNALQAETVEVPPKERVPTESGPTAVDDVGDSGVAPPTDEVPPNERIPTESGPTATGEQEPEDVGTPPSQTP